MLSGVQAPLQHACDRTVIVAQPPLHELCANAVAPGTPHTGPLGPAYRPTLHDGASIPPGFARSVTELFAQRRGAVAVEDDDPVDRREGGEELGSLGRRHDRAPRALEARHRGVVVDRHDQPVGLGARPREVAQVAGWRSPTATSTSCTSVATASRSSSAETVAVPRLRTTRPPA